MHPKNDFRNIENGYNIPKENYCDQLTATNAITASEG